MQSTASLNAACLAEAPGDTQRLEADIPALCVQNHAANLMPLPNGDLACVWFGGTQEGVPDISIYFSRLAKGSSCWTVPVKLSDDPSGAGNRTGFCSERDGSSESFSGTVQQDEHFDRREK